MEIIVAFIYGGTTHTLIFNEQDPYNQELNLSKLNITYASLLEDDAYFRITKNDEKNPVIFQLNCANVQRQLGTKEKKLLLKNQHCNLILIDPITKSKMEVFINDDHIVEYIRNLRFL